MSHIRFVLLSLSLTILLASLGTSIANVALPALANTFDAPFAAVQWVVLAYLLSITTLIVTAGRLGDLLGRRRLLLAGIALFTIASALCGFAPSLAMLIAARAVQGLGAAVMMALTLAFAGEAIPKESTGSAMGLLGTMSAAGTALGPSLGGLLLANASWRAIFFIHVPLGALSFVLAARSLPADRPASQRVRFDISGTVLLAITLAAYALAMTKNVALLLVAVLAAIVFVRVEAKAASPLIRLTMFRDAKRNAGFASNLLVTTVVMATLVVGPFHLSRALALDAATVGLVMTCGPIVAALAGVPAGRIVDRFGTRSTSITALSMMIAGALSMSVAPVWLGVAGYVLPLAILTAGYAFFQTANNTAVMSALQPDQRGVVSGLLNLSRNLGLITGASLMGSVFALAGMRVTFGVAAMLVITALAMQGWRRAEPVSELAA